jgi:hypothetical protein
MRNTGALHGESSTRLALVMSIGARKGGGERLLIKNCAVFGRALIYSRPVPTRASLSTLGQVLFLF